MTVVEDKAEQLLLFIPCSIWMLTIVHRYESLFQQSLQIIKDSKIKTSIIKIQSRKLVQTTLVEVAVDLAFWVTLQDLLCNVS